MSNELFPWRQTLCHHQFERILNRSNLSIPLIDNRLHTRRTRVVEHFAMYRDRERCPGQKRGNKSVFVRFAKPGQTMIEKADRKREFREMWRVKMARRQMLVWITSAERLVGKKSLSGAKQADAKFLHFVKGFATHLSESLEV
jgi:hypothetical protein